MTRTVAFDLPGVSVGVADDDDGPTGCTVVLFDTFARAAIDVRHDMPGIFNPGTQVVEAVCLAGGSVMGLSASAGVAEELYAAGGSDPMRMPVVSGGVIYDLAAPGRSGIYPDAALGRAAVRAARPGVVPVGPLGAGRSATCGKLGIQGWGEPAGQGAAFGTLGGVRILVLVVVNALGVIVDRAGTVVRGNKDPATGLRSHLTAEQMVHGTERGRQRFEQRFTEATTLTVVVTDARLRGHDLAPVARQIHASLARAIHPFHLRRDGDTLWMLTTNAVTDSDIAPAALGTAASELAWDAVLTSFDS
jgi:L-aminopeptidase/D-esterase-like protein